MSAKPDCARSLNALMAIIVDLTRMIKRPPNDGTSRVLEIAGIIVIAMSAALLVYICLEATR